MTEPTTTSITIDEQVQAKAWREYICNPQSKKVSCNPENYPFKSFSQMVEHVLRQYMQNVNPEGEVIENGNIDRLQGISDELQEVNDELEDFTTALASDPTALE